MADDQEKPIPPEYSKGEQQSPHWSFSFVDLTRIEAGEHIVPAKISGDLACEFAELHMISNDLSFALECLKEADKIGAASGTYRIPAYSFSPR